MRQPAVVESPDFSGLPLKQWTVDDYHHMIALGLLTKDSPVELLNGQIIEMVPQEPPHASTTDEGGDYLKAVFVGKAKVRVQFPVTLYPQSEPEPDFAVVRIDANRYRDRHPGPEDIYFLIEVADSTLRRDRQYKAGLYAQAGIREYWVVNLPQRQVIVYRQPLAGTYQSEQVFEPVDKISPEAFPTVEVNLRQLLVLE